MWFVNHPFMNHRCAWWMTDWIELVQLNDEQSLLSNMMNKTEMTEWKQQHFCFTTQHKWNNDNTCSPSNKCSRWITIKPNSMLTHWVNHIKVLHFHQSACSSHSTTCCLWALVACSVSFLWEDNNESGVWKRMKSTQMTDNKAKWGICAVHSVGAKQIKWKCHRQVQSNVWWLFNAQQSWKNEQTNKCVSEEEDERVNMKQSVKQWTRSKCCVWRGISKLQQKWRHWLKWHNTQTEQCKKQCKNHPHPHNKQQINFLCSNKCNRVSKYHKQTTGNEHVDGLWKAKGKQWWNNDIVDVLAKKMRIKNDTKWKRGGFELWGMSDNGQCLVVMFSW